MIEEIADKVSEAALQGHKIAMFHMQVLLHADQLIGYDPVTFCTDIGVPVSLAVEFRKMLALRRILRENGFEVA